MSRRAGTSDVLTATTTSGGEWERPPVRALRSLPVPVSEPYAVRSARRAAPAVPSTQGALALAFSAAERVEERVDPDFGPRSTPSRDLPDPASACTALVQAIVEVLGGSRPSAQLARWVTTDVYAGLQRRAGLAARLRRGAASTSRHAVVRRVRICEPRDGVVEACAVILDAGRVRAVALRLEGIDGRWRATAVEVG
jgi:hypothetical protein